MGIALLAAVLVALALRFQTPRARRLGVYAVLLLLPLGPDLSFQGAEFRGLDYRVFRVSEEPETGSLRKAEVTDRVGLDSALLLAGGVVAGWTLSLLGDKRRPRSQTTAAMLLLFVALVLATGLNFSRLASKGRTAAELAMIAVEMLLFHVAWELTASRRDAERFLRFFVGVGIATALVNFASYLGGANTGWKGYRLLGTFQTPGELGAYLLMPVALLAPVLAFGDRRRRPAAALGLLLLLVPLLLARSRTSAVTLAVLGVIFLASTRRTLVWLAVAALPAAFGLLFFSDLYLPQLREALGWALRDRELDTLAARLHNWSEALRMFPARPLFGYGWAYRLTWLDNGYIETLHFGGAVSLGLLLWIVWRWLRLALEALREARDPAGAALAAGWLGLVVNYVLSGATGTYVFGGKPAMAFWILAGVACRWCALEQAARREETAAPAAAAPA